MSISFKSLAYSLAITTLASCSFENSKLSESLSMQDIKEWISPEYSIHSNKIRQEIANLSTTEKTTMYADAFTQEYYAQHHDFVWITRHGINEKADTLLSWLEDVEQHALKRNSFHVDEIHKDLTILRSKDLSGTDINQLLGRLEYRLTKTFLRYAAGQRYGYINPHYVFNHLLVDEDTKYRQLYDIPSEAATDSFYNYALQQVDKEKLGAFLQEIQPKEKLYNTLQQEYKRAVSQGNNEKARLARINMERARWRYKRPSGKYVWVNLANFMLTAVDEKKDSALSMRICCGSPSHKSPMLVSEIKLLELNPYWSIPYSIIKKEIAPNHSGDSAYFERNRYRITDNQSGQQVNPASLTSAMLSSGRYSIRQDNGVGNSLGRMIFRFDNKFAVYLHDTNNPAAFNRTFRAVSHGCIRLQKPLDLAFFLMNEEDTKIQDKIRIAIDRAPVTEWGKNYLNSGARKMSSYTYDPHIPVYINYYTMYPNPKGELEVHPDNYKYDEVLDNKLSQF